MQRIAVISTPRSGNTWLRRLLATVYGLEECGAHDPAQVPWDDLPERCALQIHWHPIEPFPATLARHGFRPIVMARHPLDVLISALSFVTYSHDPENCREACCVNCPILGATPTTPEFLNYAGNEGGPDLLSYSPAWWDRPEIVRVRYEELVADTAGVLRRITAEIGGPFARPIEDAVAAHTMDGIRQILRQWPHHFFQGKPGLWKTLIPASEARRIAAANRRAFEVLGYTCDPDEALDTRTADERWNRLQLDAVRRFLADERAEHRATREALEDLRRRSGIAQSRAVA